MSTYLRCLRKEQKFLEDEIKEYQRKLKNVKALIKEELKEPRGKS